MEKKKFILCINRQYGSGGRTTGRLLSDELGVNYYDQKLLAITSEKSAIGEQFFRLADEKAGSNLLYRIFDSLKPSLSAPSIGFNITNRDNLFRFQAEMIRELASRESCIIVGRAADYVLREAMIPDVVSVYVYCSLEMRIRRIMEVDKLDRSSAVKRINQIEKDRMEYYNYYTGRIWNDCSHYDLCVNTDDLEYQDIASVVRGYLRVRGYCD